MSQGTFAQELLPGTFARKAMLAVVLYGETSAKDL